MILFRLVSVLLPMVLLSESSRVNGFGYELIQHQMEQFRELLHRMELSVSSINEQIKDTQQNVLKLERAVAGNQGEIIKNQYNYSKSAELFLTQQFRKVYDNQKKILDGQKKINITREIALQDRELMKHNQRPSEPSFSRTTQDRHSLISRTCNSDQPSKSEWKRMVIPTAPSSNVKIYCEMQSFGGGWMVVQRRVDGSVSFRKNWRAYRNGFGLLGNEFWVGLDVLHLVTSQAPHELIVELKDSAGDYSYARYSEFEIGSEEEDYKLKKLGKHSGTADDSLKYHLGRKFSTYDNDNAATCRDDCGLKYGAWWHGCCFDSNLNGEYEDGICWSESCSTEYKYSRMMIREAS